MGVTFSVLTFITASAVVIYYSHGKPLLCGCVVIAFLFSAFMDGIGNYQAFESSMQLERQAFEDRTAEYSGAITALDGPTGYRQEKTQIQSYQEIMQSATDKDSIIEAQLLLQAKGKYLGRIDGLRQGKTDTAVVEYGSYLATREVELNELIAANEAIVKKGLPTTLKDRSKYAVYFAFGFTALSAVCSFLGASLFNLGIGTEKLEAYEAYQDDTDKEIDNLLEREIEMLKEEAGTTADGNVHQLRKSA